MRTRHSVDFRILIPAASYAGWNLWFLLRGEVPPSLFSRLTGWPCPTTGGLRSLRCWLDGAWGEAFRYNPFTPVFVVLAGASACWLWRQYRRRQPLLLPRWLGVGWLGSLALAWAAKGALGPAYW